MELNLPKLDDLTEDDIKMGKRAEYAMELLEFRGWFDYARAREIISQMYYAFLEAEQAQELVVKIDEELTGKVADIRPLGIIVFGDINSGKTTLAIRFQNITPLLWKKSESNEGKTWNPYNIIYCSL